MRLWQRPVVPSTLTFVLGRQGKLSIFLKKMMCCHPGWFRALSRSPQMFLVHILITITPSEAAMSACKQSMIIIMSNGDCIPCSRSNKIMCCHPGRFRVLTSPQVFLEHILTTIPLDPPSEAAMTACKQSMIMIMSNGDCGNIV